MIKYTPRIGLTFLFGFTVLGMVLQITMSIFDINARDRLLNRLRIDSELVDDYQALTQLISDLRHDVLYVETNSQKKALYLKVQKAKAVYQSLKNDAIRVEHTDAASTKLKVHQITKMQGLLDKVINRQAIHYKFQMQHALESLKEQDDWLNLFSSIEYRKLRKDIDTYQELMSRYVFMNLYLYTGLLALAILALLYLYRKQDEHEVEAEHAFKVKHSDQDHVKALEQRIVVANKVAQQREVEINTLKSQMSVISRFESVGKLANQYSKELHNVLGAMISTGLLMAKKLKEDNYLSVKVDTLVKQGLKGVNLTKQVSKLSDPNNTVTQSINLNEVIAELQPLIEGFEDKHIQTRVVLAKEPLYVQVIVSKLIQAIMNMAINAKEAMPKGGTLTIQTEYFLDEEHKDWAKLSVIDTGAGISNDEINHIFKSGYSTKKTGEGTGFGLPKVIEIISEHRGKIEVKSGEGKGTRFDIYLPCQRDEIDYLQQLTHRLMSNPHLLGDRKFLVINAKKAEAKQLSATLTKYGSQVDMMHSSQDALDLFRQSQEYDVVLMATEIDAMDGIELYQLFEEVNHNVQVVFVGDEREREVSQSIVDTEHSAFLARPIEEAQLLKQIALLLRL